MHRESPTRKKAKAGPIMITGIPGHYVENVVCRTSRFRIPGHGTEEDAERVGRGRR